MDPRQQADDWIQADTPQRKADDWTVPDLIDFEYYLDADERELREKPSARKTLADRDRGIYLEEIEAKVGSQEPHSTGHRRLSARLWLAARRKREDPGLRGLLPGATFGHAERLGAYGLAAIGFMLGVGVGSTLLHYDGKLPVSVPWVVFLLVVLQFGLVLTAVWAWLRRSLRRDKAAGEDSWLLTHVLKPMLTRVAGWLQQQQLAHATGEIRERALATHGLLRSQFVVYGSVSIMPLVILAQVFGVAFNIGVVLTAIALEWFTDIAFGWGTSLAAHPQTIYDVVRVIASPWSWLFGEGVGYPTLEQIEGSRIYLEQWASFAPGSRPNPEHLRSWRWFLVLAITTYGLLPRLILLGISMFMQRWTLARLPFTHGRIQALYARLLTPRLDTVRTGSSHGPEMPIPSELAPGTLRSGLIGPLTPGKSGVGKRPWREEPAKLRKGPLALPTAESRPEPRDEDRGRPVPPESHEPQPPVEPPVLSAETPALAAKLEAPAESKAPERAETRPVEARQEPAEIPDSPVPAVEAEPEIAEAEPAAEPEPESEIEPETRPEPEPEVAAARDDKEEAAIPSAEIPVVPAEPVEAPEEAREIVPSEPEPLEPEEAERTVEPVEAVPEATGPSAEEIEAAEGSEASLEAAGTEPVESAQLESAPEPEAPAPESVEAEPLEPEQVAESKVAEVLEETVPEVEEAPEPEPEIEPLPEIGAGLGPVAPPAEAPLEEPEPTPEPEPPHEAPPAAARAATFAADACLLLVHVDVDDVLEEEDRPRLEQLLLELSGWRVGAYTTFGAGSAMTAQALDLLDEGEWEAPPPRITIVQDGSQPPITENLLFLRELRATAGQRAQMLLALVGDPEDEDRLPPVRGFDYTDWQRKIDQMADPYLRLDMLAPPSEEGES